MVFGGWPHLLLEKVDDLAKEAIAHVEAFGGAGHVADLDVDSGTGGAQVDGWVGAEFAESIAAGSAFPLLFGDAGVVLHFFLHRLEDAFDGSVRVDGRGHSDGDGVPHPLAGG